MKAKFLIPMLFPALTAQASDLVTDSQAYNACKQRFYNTIRDENLNVRPETFYRLPTDNASSYHYLFNASGPGADNGRRNYRVECESRRIGKVTRFTMETGRWIYTGKPKSGLASN